MIQLLLQPLTLILLLLSLPLSLTMAEEKTYRVGYFEQKPFSYQQAATVASQDEYLQTFQQVLKGKHWETLFELAPEAYISIGTNLKEEGEKQAQLLVSGAYGQLDAIIVDGHLATRAILKITNNNPNLPIFAEGIKEPIKEGFIQSENDSGIDNFTVSITPGRYSKMFRTFYNEVHFKRLGLLYHDEENKNTQTHLENAEIVAQEKEFIVLPYSLSSSRPSTQGQPKIQMQQCSQDSIPCCLTALNSLFMRGMDAFFIPSLDCFDWTKNDVKPLMDFLIDKKIPTFTQQDSRSVQGGAMMGFTSADLLATSERIAEKLYAVLMEGKKPRELQMVSPTWPRIAVNASVALKIGFNLSFEIQGASDEIYEEIWTRERIQVGGR